MEKINELVKEGKIDGVQDLRDESNSEGIRVGIDSKSGIDRDFVLLKLYKLTALQTSYGINMLALDKGIPKLMNLKNVISVFVF